MKYYIMFRRQFSPKKLAFLIHLYAVIYTIQSNNKWYIDWAIERLGLQYSYCYLGI